MPPKYNPRRILILLAVILIWQGTGYSQEKLVSVDVITVTGNKITREPVITRELVVGQGDELSLPALDSLLDKSRENIFNTLLFNFVDVGWDYNQADSSGVSVWIKVIERWYVWPVPILKISDRNFNVWWQTKDFSRLSYGFYVDWRNFRGRKENLILRFQFGYDQVYDFQYNIPYLNRKKTLGLGFGGGIWNQRETAAMTQYNKHVFYQDPEKFARRDMFAYGQFLVRKNIYNTHLFELRYDQQHFSDSLLAQNENYSIDGSNDVQYFSLRYLYKSDHRDYRNYPLKGWYFDLEAKKQGLGVIRYPSPDIFQVVANFRKYWQMAPRVYFASGAVAKVSAGESQPYFLIRGIGYERDVVRSYEYYLVDATHYGILKSNVKFALVPQTVSEFNFIRSERFRKFFYALYLNVFFDAGYGYYKQDFGRETNDLQNSLLLGYGAGIDFVSYYDIVIRVECSINFMNEAGVFLHFRAPI